jgi:hypothetical protein
MNLLRQVGFFLLWLIISSVGAQSKQQSLEGDQYKIAVSESISYKHWYDTMRSKDYIQAIDLAISHVEQYPDGRYSDYLRKWLTSMSSNRIEKRPALLHAIVMGLLDGATNVNLRLKDGKTLLMLAAFDGDTEIIKMLLERGADINAQEEKYGRTALGYAIWNGEAEVVRILLEAGADKSLKDMQNKTVIEQAQASKKAEIVELMIRRMKE